uniref:Uncharacterized protein n=1 Tax=Anopheles farauti TaxID=69004 RepID=A0A182QL20_9DIPT
MARLFQTNLQQQKWSVRGRKRKLDTKWTNCFLALGTLPKGAIPSQTAAISCRNVQREKAGTVEFDARVAVTVAIQTDQNIVDRGGTTSRCRQVATGADATSSTAPIPPVLVLVRAVVRVLLVATKMAPCPTLVLVLMVVAGHVVRIERRLVVLRIVGMRWRNQRRLDQGHILVQQTRRKDNERLTRLRLLLDVRWDRHAVPSCRPSEASLGAGAVFTVSVRMLLQLLLLLLVRVLVGPRRCIIARATVSGALVLGVVHAAVLKIVFVSSAIVVLGSRVLVGGGIVGRGRELIRFRVGPVGGTRTGIRKVDVVHRRVRCASEARYIYTVQKQLPTGHE